MELRAGYKNTEIGVIPEEWEIEKFGAIIQDYGYGPRFNANDYDINGNVKTIRGTDIGLNGEILYNQVPIAKLPNVFVENHKLKHNDLVMITTADCGLTGVFEEQNIPFIPSAYAVRISLNSRGFSNYFKYLLQTPIAKNQIQQFVRKGTVANLPGSDILNLKFKIPPLPEQKAIATVLSDTDNLLQALEKKIAKKRFIKQGAMQVLLKPKEGWVVKRLGDFLAYEQPTNYIVESTEYNANYDIPVLTAGKSFILGYTNETKGVFKKYPVIIFDDFTTATKFVTFPFKVKSSAMKILKPKNDDVNLRFIYEIMQQIDFPLGDHKRHWIGEFHPLKINVPSTKEEQTEIATILSDMDTEIENLEKQLAKYKQVKQGLMQNLLTGKIRLV